MIDVLPASTHASILTESTSDVLTHRHSYAPSSTHQVQPLTTTNDIDTSIHNVKHKQPTKSNPFKVIYTNPIQQPTTAITTTTTTTTIPTTSSTTIRTKNNTKNKNKTKSSNLSLPLSQPHKKSTPAQDFAKFQAHRWHDAQKYNQIAKNVQTGEGALLQNTTQYNNDNANANANVVDADAELDLQDASQPVITLIDSSSLRRSKSVVSREASLRYRGRIKSRNNTIKKTKKHATFADEKSEKSPIGPRKLQTNKQQSSWWPSFVFPVQRRRSLKYSSVNTSPPSPTSQSPNFTTKNELEQFLKLCNYDDLVASMLPKKTKYWKYKEPLHPHPKLHYKVGDVEGAMDTGYIGVSHHSRDTSFAKSTNNLTSKRPSIATATNPDQLLNALYEDYQKRAFEVSKQSSRRTPPKFESLYPQDSFLLSKKELNHLNTKLLMNVLLRRTVAAKLEYRLNNNRGILLPHFIQKSLSSSSSSSTSSSASSSAHSLLSRTSSANSSSSSVASGVNNNDNNNDDDDGDGSGNDDDNGGYKKHHHTKPIYSKQTKQTGTPNSNSLYNNDDLILQNQSLFGSNVFFKSASSSPSRVSKSKRTHLNLISFAPEQPQGDTEITRKSGDTSNTGNTTIAGNHVQSLDPQSYKPESFIKHLNLRDSSNYTEPSIKNLHEKDLEQLEETVQPPKFSLQPRRQNSQATLSSSEHSSTMFLTNESMLSVSFHSESNLNIIANSNANSNSDSNANSNTHLHGDTLHSAFSLASVSPVSSASKDKQIAPTVNIESTTTSPH